MMEIVFLAWKKNERLKMILFREITVHNRYSLLRIFKNSRNYSLRCEKCWILQKFERFPDKEFQLRHSILTSSSHTASWNKTTGNIGDKSFSKWFYLSAWRTREDPVIVSKLARGRTVDGDSDILSASDKALLPGKV